MPDRTLQGIATVWTDNEHLRGPKSANLKASLNITPDGQVVVRIDPINLGDNVTLETKGPGTGHFDFASGNLNVNLPVHVTNVPVLNSISTTVSLSTAASLAVPYTNESFSGSPATAPADVTGAVTLAGSSSIDVSVLLFHVHTRAWLRIAGSLLPA